MHSPRILTQPLHRIRTAFSSGSSKASTTSKSPLSSSSSFVEPVSFPGTSHSEKLSAVPSIASSINQAILVRRRPSSLELELEEERKLFGGRAPCVMEPRPTDRMDVSVVPIGGIDEIMGGR